ncbi:FAD-dependent urate hydroxylase [Nymphaea thermarum]|nr:FAD-dependent urate hydroxylase [Nymphaea thermarum]
MVMEMTEEIVIVGAGIAGLATAVGLHRVGLGCRVLERAQELRTTGAALMLFPNAWRALEALNVAHKLTPFYAPFKTASFTSLSARRTQKVPLIGLTVSEKLGLRSVHRKALLEALSEELPPSTIRLGSRLSSIEQSPGDSLITLHLEDGTRIKTKVLIGCDGNRSLVAQWMGMSEPINSGRSAIRGLAVYPDGHDIDSEMVQFLGDGVRAGYIPINKKHVYWFVIRTAHPHDEEIWKSPELIKQDVTDRVAKDWPKDYLEVVEHSDLDTLTQAPLFFRNPLSLLFGNLSRGSVTVAGDALHPMTSDIGQGGCTALEDAVVLARNLSLALRKNGKIEFDHKAIAEGLRKYGNERRWRSAALIAYAYLSGWVQSQPWRLVKMFRDKICYGLMFNRFVDLMDYNSGELPSFKLA